MSDSEVNEILSSYAKYGKWNEIIQLIKKPSDDVNEKKIMVTSGRQPTEKIAPHTFLHAFYPDARHIVQN